jgi:hypothetical protein
LPYVCFCHPGVKPVTPAQYEERQDRMRNIRGIH